MKNHARVGIVRSVMIGTEARVFLVIAVLGVSFQFVDEDVVVGDVPLPLTLILKLSSLHRFIAYLKKYYLNRDRLPQVSKRLLGEQVEALRSIV